MISETLSGTYLLLREFIGYRNLLIVKKIDINTCFDFFEHNRLQKCSFNLSIILLDRRDPLYTNRPICITLNETPRETCNVRICKCLNLLTSLKININ